MVASFTHLHVHSEYSLLDGLSKIGPLVHRAKELGMDSLALTDHGALYGAVEFYLEARNVDVKPILGCEVYVAQGSRESRSPGEKSPYHLTLLARTTQGYKNLIQLVTRANLEGFYYRPRMDRELFEQYHEGLIVLSGCPSSELSRRIIEGRMDEARAVARWYKEVFGDYYLELQRHDGIPELERLNPGLLELHRELGLPLVATNDSHYIRQEDASVQDILLCIQTTTSINDPKRMKMSDESYYLKGPGEMLQLFADFPEAVANTRRIADMCQVDLELGQRHVPHYPTPEGKLADDYLRDLCLEGAQRRFPELIESLQGRLDYELEVIRETRFANYFLVVWDIAAFARQRGILLGVRGSAAASLVLYCLGVTDVDPVKYRLVFERFLNRGRREMPDIDMDFQDDRRDEVIRYVSQKYGADHVAQIITFGTLGARAALRDVGRALALPYSDVDRVARLVPFGAASIEAAMEVTPELREMYSDDQIIHRLIDTSRKLEGVVRHASTHAAGVVISREPLATYVPLQRATNAEDGGNVMTQFAMEPIARLGLLKMDFLGLINLTILGKTVETIRKTSGIDIDLQRIPLDDRETFELLSSGETTGIFQLESAGMRRYIKELKPSSLLDVSAMIALYRPGPMQHIPTFIEAKHGRKPIRYPHPSLAGILQETYGVIVFQDQVLLIAQAFAGYTLGEADILRKAMGKKIPEIMQHEHERFIERATAKGFSRELSVQVFELIEPFAGYAFNKAHSVSYALIAYWTAYFKAHYPAEFMTAQLNCHMGQMDKTALTVSECGRLGIPVLGPAVDHSGLDFTIEKVADGKSAIRFGLAAIKNVGGSALRPVVEARAGGGPFKSIEDLCRRCDLKGLNRRALESLIKVGAFDSLAGRGALLTNVERVLALAQREARLKETGQGTMFDLWGAAVSAPLASLEMQDEPVMDSEKVAWEEELLGVALSGRPFPQAPPEVNAHCSEIGPEMAGQKVVIAGSVVSVRQLATKDKRPFCIASVRDMSGSVEVAAWSEVYQRTQELWAEGNWLIIWGKVRVREDRASVTCDAVKPYNPAEPTPAPETGQPHVPVTPLSPTESSVETNGAEEPSELRRLVLSLRETGDQDADQRLLDQVLEVLRTGQGQDPVTLAIDDGERVTSLELEDFTRYTPALHQQLAQLLGPGNITVQKP